MEPNVIFRGGEYTEVEAAVASGQTVKPGHLLTRLSGGTFRTHNVAGGNAAPLFARERSMLGAGTDESIGEGEQVFGLHARRGCSLYARVAAAASAIVRGDYLESAGDGTLRKLATEAATADTERASVVARALEDVDNSGGASEAWILVEVL